MQRLHAFTASLALAGLLASAGHPVEAKSPDGARGRPPSIVAPGPEAAALAWPEASAEVVDRYPEIRGKPTLVSLTDGTVLLGLWRVKPRAECDDSDAMWLVYLRPDGVPLRQLLIPLSCSLWDGRALPLKDGGVLIYAPMIKGMKRVDRDGNRVWRLWFLHDDDFGESEGFGVAETVDGNILIAGAAPYDPDTDSLAHRVRLLAPDSRLIWQRDFGPPREQGSPKAIRPLPDGGALVFAPWQLYRLDAAGRRLWHRALPRFFGMIPSIDGSVIVQTYRKHKVRHAISHKTVLLRIDTNGRDRWRREWHLTSPRSAPRSIERLVPAPDGGALLLFGASWYGATAVEEAAHIARVDATGAMRWQRTVIVADRSQVNTSRTPEVLGATVTPDRQVVVVGRTRIFRWAGRAEWREEEWWLRKLPFD